eukprot:TRINITY_DN532_c0_g1_i3.p1 TRINITY_DN532_c0_g1~~TRINITY_DN532_c0_g1_i3.p1  ORF type:complete len:149 (-),score=9.17 TRINITY_DN532_c0_g1_i3:62-508(-)
MTPDKVLWKKLDPSEVQYKSGNRIRLVGEYAVGRRLGEGSYGKVKEGVHIPTRRRVAIKIYAKKYIRRIHGGEELCRKEIEIMKSLDDVNIVCLIDNFEIEEKEKLYVVLEYANGGSLQDLLDRAPNGKLPLRQIRRYHHHHLHHYYP